MKKLVLWAMVVILACAGIYCAKRYYDEAYLPRKQLKDADKEQRELFDRVRPDVSVTEAQAVIEENESQPEYDPLADLKAENDESVGWLTIDGTGIDYPIVQASDNSFYLQNGFDKQYNCGLGCPFLDYRCEGFGESVSIVYAHHIQGEQAMFADIAKYKENSYMAAHPRGELLTADGMCEVDFFAYLNIPSDDYAYQVGLTEKSDRDGYIDHIFSSASYTSGFTADELKRGDTRLLLLSTCTYEFWEARGVLVGVIKQK